MTIRSYSSPEAFKQALEQRLRTSTKSGAEFARKRQLLVFDRFLARVVAVLGDAATLKGGLVIELRIERARTTKDVDLRMVVRSARPARRPSEPLTVDLARVVQRAARAKRRPAAPLHLSRRACAIPSLQRSLGCA